MSPTSHGLCRMDRLLLAGYCLLLFSFDLVSQRSLTIHESVHCVNIREMLADGDWIIPHYGGRPWLERPPLPFWLTAPVVRCLGDNTVAYRLGPLLVACGCVLLVAGMAARWYGRGVGVLSGLILATIREFAHYATAPECDMFLCGVVTLALALFVRLEFHLRPAVHESGGLMGRRPWALLGFFSCLGLANLVKGLCFGDLLVVLPVAGYLLLGPGRWALLRRYVWLPGWLAFLVIGSAWPVAAWLRYPDIVELWNSDYAGRLTDGYMGEPAWYYAVNLPYILLPWSPVAVLGLASTRAGVRGQGRTPERLLWVWALAPLLLLSIPQGKHHHYLLSALTPWAILSAVGLVRLWQWLPRQRWLHTPWPALVAVALPGEVLLALSARYLGGLADWQPALLLGWPVLVIAGWWTACQPDLQRAGLALFALLVPAYWLGHAFASMRDDTYAEDRRFVVQVRQQLPAQASLLVVNGDDGPLSASWMLFYLEGRAQLLHNPTFLLGQLPRAPIYLIARQDLGVQLSWYGQTECVLSSRRSRDERTSQERYALYRWQRYQGLCLHPDPVRISPMQATGRAAGPSLLEQDSAL